MSQISPALGIAVAAALLWGAFKMVGGKDSKLAKLAGYVAAIFGVGALLGNAGKVQAMIADGFTNHGNTTTEAPQDKKNSGDVITDEWRDIQKDFGDKWGRFTARFTNAPEWQKLMLDPRIGKKIATKYPTGALLAVLNPDATNEYNKKGKGTPAQEKEIKKILDTLTIPEKNTLNTMLQETWENYKDAQGKTLTYDQLKKGTPKDMIDSIDVQYGWCSTIYFRPAYWFGETENRQALIEFTKHPKEWGSLRIGDLIKLWYPVQKDLDPSWLINQRVTTLFDKNTTPPGKLSGMTPENLAGMKKVILKIWEANGPGCNPRTTLKTLFKTGA